MSSFDQFGEGDVVDFTGDNWLYSDEVKDHFFNPKNLLLEEPNRKNYFNAIGMVGAPACGDMMKLWLRIDSKTEKIKECKWRTYGCASAIASTSVMSVMVTEKGGMTLKRAIKLKAGDILERLGGLPARKIHCSVLGDKALQAAINNYFYKTKQFDRVVKEGSRIVDRRLGVTEADIEEVIARGAKSYRDVQNQLKIGAGLEPMAKAELQQLVRYYLEQYGARNTKVILNNKIERTSRQVKTKQTQRKVIND